MAAWEEAPLVSSSPSGKAAWESAPLVDVAASPAPTSEKKPSRFEQMGSNPLVRGAYGLAEGATNMITGMGASAVGGIEGINKLLSGGTADQATERIRAVQDRYTYQPRTAEGAATAHVAGLPIEYAGKLGGFMGKNSGIAELTRTELGAEMIGEKVPEAIATVLMGRAGLNKAANRPNVTGTKNDPYVQAQAVKESVANAGTIEAGKLANQYGIAIDPRKVNPSIGNKVNESWVKANDKAEALTKENIGKPEHALKLDVGIPAEVPLSLESIKAARDAAGGSRAKIQEIPRFTDDGSVSQTIASLQPGKIAGDAASQKAVAVVIDDVISQINNGMSGADALRNIEQLRAEARKTFSSTATTPEGMAQARAKMGVSNALENLIDQNLTKMAETNPSYGRLLENYKKDRVTQAKTYTLEDIFDDNTKSVKIDKLAKLTAEDNALTGPFADFGKIAGVFPESFHSGSPLTAIQRHLARSGVPASVGMGIGTVIAPGLGTLGGAVLGAGVGEIASILGSKRIASKGYQKANATPVDARPMRQALGYEKVEMGPEPVVAPVESRPLPKLDEAPPILMMEDAVNQRTPLPVLAEDLLPVAERYQGTNIPIGTIEAGGPAVSRTPLPVIPREGRGLLSLEEMTANAVRNRAVPEQGVDFMGKTEFWQQPAMKQATEAFIQRAEELKSIINNKYPIDGRKQAAAAMELAALEKEFGAGAKLGGLRNEKDAYTANYQAGGETQLPIEKTFDPRITAAILGRR